MCNNNNYTLGNLKCRFHDIKKNQVSNGESHALPHLSPYGFRGYLFRTIQNPYLVWDS